MGFASFALLACALRQDAQRSFVTVGKQFAWGRGDDFAQSFRRRRPPLAYLLAGTALASASFTPDAAAVCIVSATGGFACVNTTTTNTTNLNGAAAASSDRIQNFNNGANITATIFPAVRVDGFGLNLVLSNAGGNNTIGVTNDGVITTSQSVAALQLNGNGGTINYFGVGTVSNTTSGVAANATSGVGLLITNTGAGGVNIVAPGGSVIGATNGIDVTTANGSIQIQNLALVQGNNGAGIRAITGGGGITITGNSQITGLGGFGILARSFGGASTIANNGNITEASASAWSRPAAHCRSPATATSPAPPAPASLPTPAAVVSPFRITAISLALCRE